MKALVQKKQKAIALRKRGFSYNEILLEVPVAKSSLSLWLKDLPLTTSEKSVLKKRKNSNISRGRIKAASELRKRRLEREKFWFQDAAVTFERFKDNTLFHSGVSLYWAEGSKRSDTWQFSNSDISMIEVMLLWLEQFCEIDRKNARYRLYAHKAYAHKDLVDWWRKELNLNDAKFGKTTYKSSQYDFRKRPNYKGCFRIEVPKSRYLLCKMKFWQEMLVEYYKKQ